jgi:DNA-binding PadR family transcriptional regulator
MAEVSATRLLVLGVVRMHGKAHGYQVRRELLAWSADKWANVKPGSIYHALKKMSAEKLLEEVEFERGEGGPDRMAYRLTPAGEAEFEILLTRSLSSPGVTGYDMSAAVTFMTALPRQRVVDLLRHQLVRLENDHRSAVLLLGQDFGEPAHVGALYRLWERHAEASVGWLNDLIGRLEAGEYVMADDPGRAFGEPGPPSNQI